MKDLKGNDMKNIGFIGMGNMGSAILTGLLKHGFAPETLLFTDVSQEKRESVTAKTGVESVSTNAECAMAVSYLVLAVKPQYYETVLEEIRPALIHDPVLISIAPGKSVAYLKEMLGQERRIVRAMPNTPALLGEGMTGVCFDPEAFSEEENNLIAQFFSSLCGNGY